MSPDEIKSTSENKFSVDKRTLIDIMNRLTRIETKVVRGFDAIGVNTNIEKHWFIIDDQSKEIKLKTLGRSIYSLLKEIEHENVSVKTRYTIVFDNEKIGDIFVKR